MHYFCDGKDSFVVIAVILTRFHNMSENSGAGVTVRRLKGHSRASGPNT